MRGRARGPGRGGVVRRRTGLTSVSSDGEKASVSRDRAGVTLRQSGSAGSASAISLPDRPSAMPTAAAVNHTVGRRPCASSVASCSMSLSDNECEELGRDGMVYSGAGKEVGDTAEHARRRRHRAQWCRADPFNHRGMVRRVRVGRNPASRSEYAAGQQDQSLTHLSGRPRPGVVEAPAGLYHVSLCWTKDYGASARLSPGLVAPGVLSG